MCGAYGFSVKDAQEVYNRFDIENTLEDFRPRFNVRPGQMNPVVTRACLQSSSDAAFRKSRIEEWRGSMVSLQTRPSHSPNKISRMFWGLIPHFAHDEHYKYKTINAKAETVAKLPTFREPFRHMCCIVPATGFFEPDKKYYSKPPFPSVVPGF
jgi:putative SOS response-associated peptidase YedK